MPQSMPCSVSWEDLQLYYLIDVAVSATQALINDGPAGACALQRFIHVSSWSGGRGTVIP